MAEEETFDWELKIVYNADDGSENGNICTAVRSLRNSEVLDLFKIVKGHIQTVNTTGVKKPLVIEIEEDEDDDGNERIMQKICINTDVLSFWISNPNEE